MLGILLRLMEKSVLPVKVVRGEGIVFSTSNKGGEIFDVEALTKQDEKGTPTAFLIPEGALLDTKAFVPLSIRLRHEITRKEIYDTLRSRLARRMDFSNLAKEIALRHAAENLATLAEPQRDGISKRIRRNIVKAEGPFVDAWARTMGDFKDWISKNEVIASLNKADAAALGLFPAGKTGQDFCSGTKKSDSLKAPLFRFTPSYADSG